MTVQELITHLQQVENKELPVIIAHTDHTDYTYLFGMEDDEISIGTESEIYGDDGEEITEGWVLRVNI